MFHVRVLQLATLRSQLRGCLLLLSRADQVLNSLSIAHIGIVCRPDACDLNVVHFVRGNSDQITVEVRLDLLLALETCLGRDLAFKENS